MKQRKYGFCFNQTILHLAISFHFCIEKLRRVFFWSLFLWSKKKESIWKKMSWIVSLLVGAVNRNVFNFFVFFNFPFLLLNNRRCNKLPWLRYDLIIFYFGCGDVFMNFQPNFWPNTPKWVQFDRIWPSGNVPAY